MAGVTWSIRGISLMTLALHCRFLPTLDLNESHMNQMMKEMKENKTNGMRERRNRRRNWTMTGRA